MRGSGVFPRDQRRPFLRRQQPPLPLGQVAQLDGADTDADQVGDLQADQFGHAADLVLLEANPLEDIANTRRLHAVLLAGRLYDRPRLDALLDFTRAQARSPANAAKLVWGFLASSVSGEL